MPAQGGWSASAAGKSGFEYAIQQQRIRRDLHRRGSDRTRLGLACAGRGGAHVPGEASVDPRRVVAALLAALDRHGAGVHSGADVVAAEHRADGWRVETADGRTFTGAALVLAAGCWSGRCGW